MKLAKKIKFTLVFIMDIKVNNHETKQRCKEALLPGLAKANTLTRSHEEEQGEVRTGDTPALKGQLEDGVEVEEAKKNDKKCPGKCGCHKERQEEKI
ncbi:hypothetical protein J1605_007550 [Eschrichtius robustus]|uniref:Prothymosin alpha n=1 Tax=Eschrichtius robustus TaxID=9764 RepID=A0AB34GZX9_ESCRO|nr:hypothetical protein J1605_007550 [Eschrichtius robustus]